MHKLAQSVLGYIRKHDLLRAGDRLAIAVSGGADSVALLRILLELCRELGIVLSVAHFNHKLRGAESDADEQFVRKLAATHDLPFISESRDVKVYAGEEKLSLEKAARELRYRFFREALESRKADKVATAHTLDDQAETVLLKLVRGAGTRGLAGIYPRIAIQYSVASNQQSAVGTQQSALSSQSEAALIRPLLSAKRIDLESYLAELGQIWREDSSNRELRHTRNRVRHEILPRLEQHANPRVRESLSEAAEIARAEEEFWSEKIENLLPQVWIRCDNGGHLNGTKIDELGLALQRRLIRAAAESLGLNLEFRHVEDVTGLTQEGAQTVLPQGWLASCHKGQIKFERVCKEPAHYEYHLAVPGKISLSEAGIIIEAVTISRPKSDPQHSSQPLLDLNSTVTGLIVRNWRAGDRFWPANTKAPKKIKELLQDRHITGEEKKLWPVIASGDEVVWVRGLGVRRDFQAKGGEGVLILELPID